MLRLHTSSTSPEYNGRKRPQINKHEIHSLLHVVANLSTHSYIFYVVCWLACHHRAFDKVLTAFWTVWNFNFWIDNISKWKNNFPKKISIKVVPSGASIPACPSPGWYLMGGLMNKYGKNFGTENYRSSRPRDRRICFHFVRTEKNKKWRLSFPLKNIFTRNDMEN